MTLTLPTPDAGNTARQRFALELLLQQPVPGPEQLLASRKLLNDALPDVSPDQWRALQAMPIAIGADHLDIAIPSQWRDQEWQQLIDQLPDQHRTIRLHPAISKGASTDVIRQLALESGMVTLLGYSLELVRRGETTLEEVGRMVLTDSGLESERRARTLSTMTCGGCGAGLQEGWLECPYCLTPRH